MIPRYHTFPIAKQQTFPPSPLQTKRERERERPRKPSRRRRWKWKQGGDGPVPVRAGAGRQPRAQNAGRAAPRRRRRRCAPLYLALLLQDPAQQAAVPDRRRTAVAFGRAGGRPGGAGRARRGVPPVQGRPGPRHRQALAVRHPHREAEGSGVRRPPGQHVRRQLEEAAREGGHPARPQGRGVQARRVPQRLDLHRQARPQGVLRLRRRRRRAAQPHRPRRARPALRVRVRRRARVQPTGAPGAGQHEAAHVHLQVLLPQQQRSPLPINAVGAGEWRAQLADCVRVGPREGGEGAEGVVGDGARPVGFAGGSGLDGYAVRGVSWIGPGEPLQPGGVARAPAWRRHVEAVGPPGVLARARRRCGRRQPRVPVRAPPPGPHRHGRRRVRGRVQHPCLQGRPLRHRPDGGAALRPDRVPRVQPARQRRLRVRAMAVRELPGVRDVCGGAGRGSVQPADGGGGRGARGVRGGRGGVRGAGSGGGPEHGRVQALLAPAPQGALAIAFRPATVTMR